MQSANGLLSSSRRQTGSEPLARTSSSRPARISDNLTGGFLRSQEEVIKEAERAPYACISEVVDLSQVLFGLDRRMYRVWIQADFIYAGDKKQSIGCVVIYHPVEVTIDPNGKLMLPELL
jgi:hypothetical protein